MTMSRMRFDGVLVVCCMLGSAQGASRHATTTTLTISPSPSVAGATVTLTASIDTAASDERVAGAVEFYSGVTRLGTVAVAVTGATQASLNVKTFSVGEHELTARYVGHQRFLPSASIPIAHIVTSE